MEQRGVTITMPKLFLSYAHHDRFVAAWLRHSLKNDYEVFWDRDIPSQKSWDTCLADQILSLQEGGVFVVLASEYWLGSPFCKREYNYAVEKQVNGAILLLDDKIISLPRGMGSIQYFSMVSHFERSPDDFLQNIVESLKNAETFDSYKHALDLPADKSFEKALTRLYEIIKEINPENGRRGNELHTQLETIYEVLADNILNGHCQHLSKILNGDEPGDFDTQKKTVLKRIGDLKEYIQTFALRSSS